MVEIGSILVGCFFLASTLFSLYWRVNFASSKEKAFTIDN